MNASEKYLVNQIGGYSEFVSLCCAEFTFLIKCNLHFQVFAVIV